MSYEFSSTKNRQPKHPKVQNQQYLSCPSEPKDVIFHDSQYKELEEKLENSYFSRRHFRSIAQDLRGN